MLELERIVVQGKTVDGQPATEVIPPDLVSAFDQSIDKVLLGLCIGQTSGTNNGTDVCIRERHHDLCGPIGVVRKRVYKRWIGILRLPSLGLEFFRLKPAD